VGPTGSNPRSTPKDTEADDLQGNDRCGRRTMPAWMAPEVARAGREEAMAALGATVEPAMSRFRRRMRRPCYGTGRRIGISRVAVAAAMGSEATTLPPTWTSWTWYSPSTAQNSCACTRI
jgi:hypothetical protein